MAGGPPPDAVYSTKVGYVLVYNLIVGTGALALPKAFQSAGYILSIILLVISCFTSYACATFVIEGMAVANAANKRTQLRRKKLLSEKDLEDAYEIKSRVEVSTMARMFLGKYGVLLLSLVMSVYLFGDLAIYSSTVPKSIMNIICGSVSASSVGGNEECRPHWPTWLNRMAVYRLCVCAFVLFVTPLAVIGVTKTRFLQILTSLCRWLAFILMIVLSIIQLAQDGSPKIPPAAKMQGFGSLFGTTVYAFMCHHSLPSLVTPMRSKRLITLFMALVYILVLIFYVALSITGAFAFEEIFDVYSLNFFHSDKSSVFYQIVGYFLALFPVFTLTSNYPIVANTLTNNFNVLVDLIGELIMDGAKMPLCGNSVMGIHPDYLTKYYLSSGDGYEKSALLSEDSDSDSEDEMPTVTTVSRAKKIQRYIIMFVAIIVATVVSICTDNVLILSSITGSYPGVGVQYIIPALIAIFGRRYSRQRIGREVPSSVASPFYHIFWPVIMLFWSAFTIVMVTLNFCNVFD